MEIKHGKISIKKYAKVTYLGCERDENLSGEAMVLKIINKINGRLRFLNRKNRYLSPHLKRLPYNDIIQPHFGYACSAWYPNLNKKFKGKLQTIQNECIRLCFLLDNRNQIGKEIEQINWLCVSGRFLINAFCFNAFKFFNENCPLYLHGLYKTYGKDQINTRSSILKLKHPSRSMCSGQTTLSYFFFFFNTYT